MYIFVNDSAYLPFRTDCAKSKLINTHQPEPARAAPFFSFFCQRKIPSIQSSSCHPVEEYPVHPDQNSIQKPKHPERNFSIVPVLKIVRRDICIRSGFDLRLCLVFSPDLDGILPIDKKITRF